MSAPTGPVSDEMVVRKVRMGASDFSLVLPGTWVSIPLDNADAMKHRISMLVKAQFGMDDRLAYRRNQLRGELLATAQGVAAQNAVAFSLALEMLPGVPFGASMLARHEPWPASETVDRERLLAAHPGATVLELSDGLAARIAHAGTQKYVEHSSPSLDIDYWIPAPFEPKVLAISFSAPMAPESELFIQLFDSIVESLFWHAEVVGDEISTTIAG